MLCGILFMLFYQQATAENGTEYLPKVSISPGDTSQFQKPGRLKRAKKIKKDDDEQEDGVDDDIRARAHQEFLQRRDPQLNRVPIERLLVARQKRDQFLNDIKVRIKNAGTQGNVIKPLGNIAVPNSGKPDNAPGVSPASISGLQWQERGPNNVGGRTRALIFDMGDAANGYKRVIAGGVGGGLWLTSDITATPVQWTKINDFFDNIAISAIAQNPVNPLEIYAATGEGFLNGDAIQGLGVWKSSDGGVTWTHLTSTEGFKYINAILVDKNGSVYVAGESDIFVGFGVDQSVDGGNTWTNVINPAEAGADLQLAANGDVYASTGVIYLNGHIYMSDYTVNGVHTGNAGAWTNITPSATGVITPSTTSWNRIKLATAPSDANIVYAFFEPDYNSTSNLNLSSVQQYNKSANAWTVKTVPTEAFSNGQSWYSIAAAVDPNNPSVLYAGSLDAEKSIDGGQTWTEYTYWSAATSASNYVHADHHAYVYAPGSSTRLLMGTDGGVFYTVNANVTPSFVNKNNGYNVTQFYSVAQHPTNLNYSLAGAQDNGSQKFSSAGIGPTTVATGGDGGDAFIDQTNGNIQVTSYVYDQYYVSTNNGVSFTGLQHYGNGQFINPTAYDPITKSLYAGSASGYYYRAENILSPAYAEVNVSGFAGANVTAVAVSPLTANRVYFGLDNGNVVRVDNAQTGTALAGVILSPNGGVAATVSCINVDTTNEDHILVTYSNYGVTHIIETKNASAATPVWTNVSGNLPDMPVRWSLFYPGDPTKAIIATELGVWTTDLINGASTVWDPSNTGLANVEVDMLNYRATDKTIAAATHGRGVFTANIKPVLAANGPLSALSTTSGTASSSESFSISGSNLTGNITVTAPAGFDVSPDNTAFTANYTVTTTGTLASTPVYVRLDAGDAVNSYSGSVSISGGGATTVTEVIPSSSVSLPGTTVTSITPVSSSPTKATTVDFTVSFATALTTPPPTGDFTLSGTASGTINSVSGSGTTYDVKVTNVSGNGSLELDMTAAADVSPAVSDIPFKGAAYTIDNTPPSLTSLVYLSNNANSAFAKVGDVVSLNFGANEALQAPAVSIAGHSITATNAGGNNYSASYTMTTADAEGRIPFSLTITDIAGNQSFYTDVAAGDDITFDKTPPTVTISAPSVASVSNNGSGAASYTVTFADANFKTSALTNSNITLNSTGTAAGTLIISGSGTSYTVTVSAITGTGTLGITVGSDAAFDNAGNTSPASAASATFNVLNSDATLSSLVYSQGVLSPVFSQGTTSYTNHVANGVTSLTVTPITNDPKATVTVNGAPVTSGTASVAITLAVGTNTITTTVTAQDGVTTDSYVVTVTRAPATNASLSAIKLSPSATLTTVTGPDYADYTASVSNATTSIQVIPTTAVNTSTVTVNGVTVASGTVSAAIALNAGPNIITIVVTAQDGKTTRTYGITVTRLLSTNALLSSLSLTPATTLTTVAGPDYKDYTAAVSNGISSIQVTPTTADNTATVTVNGVTVASGTASAAIALNAGANTITVAVIAQDGKTTLTYGITVTRSPSNNASLSAIKLSPAATLTTVAGPDYADYTASVSNAVSSIQVIPTTAVASSTVTVNGLAVVSGTASAAIALNAGPNTISIVVTAQDGKTTRTYGITITRAVSTNALLSSLSLNPATPVTTVAGPDYADYTASVSNTTSSIKVIPTTTVNTSTVTVNGVTVASGTASAAIALNVGSNKITVVVIAQDGKTTLTYGLTITRPLSNNATLSTLSLTPATTLTTVTGPDYKDYIASVSNATTSIQVIPTTAVTTATVAVNGTSVISGTVSAAIPLTVGTNTITTTVTAQDGVTIDSYVITVTRAPATNASLSAIKLSPTTTLTTVAGPDYADYTASVVNAVSSIQVIPTTAVATSTVTVNGQAVASGKASAAIALNAGPNTISIVVTAQDGKTTRTYGITVTRAPSTNALLSSLSLNPATPVTTVAGPDYADYTASVSNATASIQVIPTTAVNTSTVTVNGVTVASSTPSAAITLNIGANRITIIVTAQDGKTSLTYGLTVIRPLSTNATLSSLTLTPATSLTTVAGPDYRDYTAAVSNTATSIQVTPTTADNTATVKVNGVTVTSGTASAAILLAVGSNTITTTVTAQDGVTVDSYVITVTRAASTNASLSAIKLSPTTTLTTVTGPDYADYTASVANTVSSIQVIATTAATTSTITVNSVTVASGVASGAIALNVGANTIAIVVTAQNGVTTHTYGITVTRAPAPANSVYEQVSVSNPADHPQIMGEEINVHQGLSPNGDGINDFLMIDGIVKYPDNHLLIMNRSGQLIFEAKGYDNSSKVFDGHSNKNGAMQLPGTYFYRLDYAVQGASRHKTGFIILKY